MSSDWSVACHALESLSGAFAARDLEAALACFALDDDVVYAGSEVGEVATGRDELRSLLGELFGREVSYSWEVTKLWSSRRSEVVLVVAEALAHSRGPDGEEDFAYRLSGVLSPGAEGWHWVQLHGAEPAVVTEATP